MSTVECSALSENIQKLLGEYVQEASQGSHFSQRANPLTAERFTQGVVLGWLRSKRASLNERAHSALDLGCQISASALQQWLDGDGVMRLARVLSLALRRLQQTGPLPLARLQEFKAIYITDR